MAKIVFRGVRGFSAFVCVAVALTAALAEGSQGRPTTMQSTADEWATSIFSVVGDPNVLHLSQKEMARRLQAAGLKFENDEQGGGISIGRPNGVIVDLQAEFNGRDESGLGTLEHFKFTLQRTDAEGHEVYPRLRRLLAGRLVRPKWLASPGWNRANQDRNFEASWRYAKDGHWQIFLTDKGWELTLELIHFEYYNEVP